MRFLTPILFFLAGGWVWWTNGQHPDRVVVLPFMDILSDDVHEQGMYTAWVCWAIAAWFFLWDLLALLRKKRDRIDV
jgi:hypothetical protein